MTKKLFNCPWKYWCGRKGEIWQNECMWEKWLQHEEKKRRKRWKQTNSDSFLLPCPFPATCHIPVPDDFSFVGWVPMCPVIHHPCTHYHSRSTFLTWPSFSQWHQCYWSGNYCLHWGMARTMFPPIDVKHYMLYFSHQPMQRSADLVQLTSALTHLVGVTCNFFSSTIPEC